MDAPRCRIHQGTLKRLDKAGRWYCSPCAAERFRRIRALKRAKGWL